MAKVTVTNSLGVRKIEVVQAVQSALNDVPLVFGKPTYVRVYLNPTVSQEHSQIEGYVKIRSGSTVVLNDHRSIETLRLERGLSLHEQRLDWSKSLNFLLPNEFWKYCSSSSITVELAGVKVTTPEGSSNAVNKLAGESTTKPITVLEDPELNCRIVLFRHRDINNRDFIEPSKGDAEAIKRYVENVFPVARVAWSTMMAAAPTQFRALGKVARNSGSTDEQITRNYIVFFQRLLSIRDQDIKYGRDPRTLYLGLLSDPSGRFGGAAMDSPQFAAPHVVAFTAAEPEGQLGAHELSHILGCRHPGIPDRGIHGPRIGQRHEPRSLQIHPSGFLSSNTNQENGEIHLGLDIRFNRHAPAILPHHEWFDLMTYRHPKWVSKETYIKLLENLAALKKIERYPPDRLVEKIRKKKIESLHAWTVIGEYDVMRKTGRIYYLARSNYLTPMPPRGESSDSDDEGFQLGDVKLSWDTGVLRNRKPVVATECVNIRNFKTLDGSPNFGVFQHTLVPNNSNMGYRGYIPENSDPNALGEEFDESLKSLINKNGCLQLMVKNIVVDQVGGCNEKDQDIWLSIDKAMANSLFKSDDVSSQPNESQVSGGLSLRYSVEDGGYYLHYKWRDKKDARKYRVTTSIACKRKRQLEKNGPEWETVAVSGRLADRVWISPVFFENPLDKKDSQEIQHDLYGDFFYGGEGIIRQSLELRIEIFVGFKTKIFEGEISIPDTEIISCGSRSDGDSHISHPDSKTDFRTKTKASRIGREKLKQRRYWYKDTASICKESEDR